jgi:hypothetical protein
VAAAIASGERRGTPRAGFMRRRALRPAAIAILALISLAASPPPASRQRGVSWVADRGEVSPRDFDRLVSNGVTWIAQNPFGWQRGLDVPEVLLRPDAGWWGETDVGLEATLKLARARGIRTLLRPHLYMVGPEGHGTWVGHIAMKSDEHWRQWFDSYRRFILHHARLAQRTGVDLLCVGAELGSTTRSRSEDWRRLIADVRAEYRGPLTYAANWDEFETITFWDLLDYIGIQAYFPLAAGERPSVEALAAAWQPHVAAVEAVSRRFGKPVLFTELGYASAPGSAARPWEWAGLRRGEPATPDGLALQSDAYEAFFRTVWHKEWLSGVYFWKWYPGLERNPVPPGSEFSPQNKPAEKVMARWFLGEEAR